MFSIELSKVPNIKAIAVVLMAFTAILGPFWYIFEFAPYIFNKYNLLTMLFLSGSYGLPLLTANCAFLLLTTKAYKKETSWPVIGCLGSLYLMFILYIPMGFAVGKHIPLAAALVISMLIQFILPNGIFLISLFMRPKKRINTPATPCPAKIIQEDAE